MTDQFDTTRLTNEVGNPVADNNHTLTAGERGPMMLQDNWMIEKLAPSIARLSPRGACTRRGRARTARSR